MRKRLTSCVLAAALSLAACSRPAPPPAPAASGEIAWPANRVSVFDLELISSSRMLSAPVPAQLILRAKLDVSVRQEAGKQQALLAFRDAHFVDAAGHDVPGTEQLATAMQAPLVLELEHGEISAYLEAPSPALAAVGLRRHVASALQLGKHESRSSWQASEWDATGRARVAYSAVPGKSNVWSWKKLSYEQVVSAQQRSAQATVATEFAPKVTSSSGELMLDEQGLLAVNRNESIEVPLSANDSLSSVSELHLHRREQVAAANSATSFARALQGAQRSAVGTPPALGSSSAADEARIAGHSFPEVLTQLEALDADKHEASAARKGPLFHALVGLFRQQPETIALAVKAIRSGSSVGETLLDALAMASTTEALSALEQLTFDDSRPQPQRVRAAGSLIRASHPTLDSLRATLRMLDVQSLHEHGLLGLGSFTRQLREQGDVEAAKQGTAALNEQLAKAKAPDDQQTVLLAIANSGSPDLYAVVLPFQDSDNSSLRDAAIQAIRLMPRPEVEARLISLLDRKNVTDVGSALHAVGRRDATAQASLDRVVDLAEHHDSADVRREAVLVLQHWSAKWPKLANTLAGIHQKDLSQRVRDVAAPKSAQ